MNKEKLPPSRKQLEFCYGILKRVKECEADEKGQPLFEKSMAEADKFIKKHRTYPENTCDDFDAGSWGIPNH